jgi:hypothetical protein
LTGLWTIPGNLGSAGLALALHGGSSVVMTGPANDAPVDLWNSVVWIVAEYALPGPAVLTVNRVAVIVEEVTDASVWRLRRVVGRHNTGHAAERVGVVSSMWSGSKCYKVVY